MVCFVLIKMFKAEKRPAGRAGKKVSGGKTIRGGARARTRGVLGTGMSFRREV